MKTRPYEPLSRRLAVGGIWIAIFLLCGANVLQADVELHSGDQLRNTLDSQTTVSWTEKPVREALVDLSKHLRVAVLLDRRIDPSLLLRNVRGGRVQQVLESIAAEAGAELRLVGNVAYVGPPKAARVARTLIALRADELSRLPNSRAARLRHPGTLSWNDLDGPDEILAQIASRYDLTLEGLEELPLDMWAGAVLPDTSAVEQLTLVLVQFNLTFKWEPDGRGVRIVPLPEEVSLERAYPVQHGRAEVLAQRGREAIAGLETEAEGETVRARGTLEQHERLAELLRSGRSAAGGRRAASGKKRTTTERVFSLRVRGGTLRAVLRTLEIEHGFEVVVDEGALAAAGASLDTRIELDVERVSLADLLKTVLDPLGLAYEIDGRRIQISAPPAP